MEKRLYSLKETALMCNLSESLLYKWVESKKIRHVRAGRKILFRHEDIELWISENTIEVVDWDEKARDLIG